MIASKRDSSDIYDGCLNYLKENLTAYFSDDVEWFGVGIKGLVGSSKQYNTHNHYTEHSYISLTILFGDNYIFPVAYSLMGRRDPTYKYNYLKGWTFSGRNKNGVWKNLSSYSNKPFSFGEKRTFLINAHESFNAFKLQMTEKDTDDKWYICIGQIDVYGDIYSTSKYYPSRNCRTKSLKPLPKLLSFCVLMLC